MSKFEDHCKESIRLFGKSYYEVHLWLDALANIHGYALKHRKERHHEAGIEKARMIFGEDAVKAARRHIIDDLKMVGWTEKDPFPTDENDYDDNGYTVKKQKEKQQEDPWDWPW